MTVALKMSYNVPALPMVGNYIFVRLELLPGSLIKIKTKNLSWALFVLLEPQYNRITAADCFNVQPHYGNTNVSGSFVVFHKLINFVLSTFFALGIIIGNMG
jgi:hypothetical protein